MTQPSSPPPAICDYEGSTYRTDFWEGKGREYEDAVERLVLRRFLPRRGKRYADFGAGFGRLIDEAAGFDEVVVVDYSRTMLQEAQARLGRAERFIYVAADLYKLPFAADAFDAALLCRVVHHLADAPAALRQIRQCMASGSIFVLEFANKLNLKAILRYALGRQAWSPYSLAPHEFVRLNFNFHPAYIRQALVAAGFTPRRRVATSWLRLGLLKRLLPLRLMVALDRILQPLGSLLPYAPQIFVESQVCGAPSALVPREQLFKCPLTGAPLRREGDLLVSAEGNPRWAIRDGIYDLKEPLA
ncbi:MAG: class I SAM-dependent methyltransferase [Chloroflexi bacterium]|jgi:SAM-dependent methyltransferase|nr:class I SAM-dependent methyltransferase [Chloroflexota bacterium]